MTINANTIRELLDAATPGPWEVDQFDEQFVDCPEVTEFYLCSEDMQYIAKGEAVSKYRDREEANFRLIALAPQLAQEVLRMRKELQALSEVWEAVSIDPDRTPAEQQLAAAVVDHIDQILGDTDE